MLNSAKRPGPPSGWSARGSILAGLKEKEGSDAMDRSRSPKRLCVICLEDLGEAVTTLECSHVFHRACLVGWFRRNPTCPTCRSLPDTDTDEDLEAELSTLPPRMLATLVADPLRAARRRGSDPALRRAAQAYRRARDAARQSSRAERELRTSEPLSGLLRELRALVQIDVSRRRAAGLRAADLLRIWQA